MINKLTYCGEYNFGELIKSQRVLRDYSIRELADLTGFSSAAISRWESGKRVPSVESFNKIMTALGAELTVVAK